jgi:hypothetical protein
MRGVVRPGVPSSFRRGSASSNASAIFAKTDSSLASYNSLTRRVR